MLLEVLLFLVGCVKQFLDMISGVVIYGTVSVFSFFFGLYFINQVMHFILEKVMGVGSSVLRAIDNRSAERARLYELSGEMLNRQRSDAALEAAYAYEASGKSINRQRSEARYKEALAYEASGRSIEKQRSRAAYTQEMEALREKTREQKRISRENAREQKRMTAKQELSKRRYDNSRKWTDKNRSYAEHKKRWGR